MRIIAWAIISARNAECDRSLATVAPRSEAIQQEIKLSVIEGYHRP